MGLRTTRRGLVAAAMALGLADDASAQPLREITIGQASKSLSGSVPAIADEMGLFAKRGIRPKFVMLDSANATTTALIARSVDIAIAGSSDAIVARSRGQNIVIIANIFSGLSASLVLSKKAADKLGTSPVAPIAERLKALNGLTIASTSATSAFTIAYGQAAKRQGATIRFTFMALAGMVAALESGAIDGFTGTGPFWAIPVERGTGVLWVNGPKSGELPDEFRPATTGTLQTLRSYAEAHPDIVKSLNEVALEYADAVEKRPSDVKAAIKRIYPDLTDGMLDLLFGVEGAGFAARPLTAADMAHEIAFVKLAGTAPPQIDEIKPADLLYP